MSPNSQRILFFFQAAEFELKDEPEMELVALQIDRVNPAEMHADMVDVSSFIIIVIINYKY